MSQFANIRQKQGVVVRVLVKSTVLKAWEVPQMYNRMAEDTYTVGIKGTWKFLQSSSFNIYQNENNKKMLLLTVTFIDQEKML